MGIGVSVVLLAVGAILTFAVHAVVAGISLTAVGIILMIVGAIGLAVALTVSGPRRSTGVVEERVYERDASPY